MSGQPNSGRREAFVLGVLAGLGAALVLGVFLAVGGFFAWRAISGEEASSRMEQATLTVADDGCGVVRDGPQGSPDMLQWVVRDEAGFQVLGRNAESEDRYRYFVPGNFTVVLQAHDGEKYVEVSNEVEIHCP